RRRRPPDLARPGMARGPPHLHAEGVRRSCRAGRIREGSGRDRGAGVVTGRLGGEDRRGGSPAGVAGSSVGSLRLSNVPSALRAGRPALSVSTAPALLQRVAVRGAATQLTGPHSSPSKLPAARHNNNATWGSAG